MKNLTATTPVGDFTRKTNSCYAYVNVWASPRAARVAAEGLDCGRKPSGVAARWVKDRGYGVTWHFTAAAAAKSARAGYGWDKATLVGTFSVNEGA